MAKQYFANVTREWEERIVREAEQALRDTIDDAEDTVREVITASETAWGRARQAGEASGPPGSPTPREHAGRRETDTMYNEVDSHVEEVSERVWEGRVGWSDPEQYFLIQEHGYEAFDTNIVPMESLSRALDQAEADLDGRLRSIIQGAR